MDMWKTDKWWVSPYNFSDEVRKNMKFEKQIQLHDVTMRDGEQQPGVVFRKEEKVKLAQKMDEVGIHRIEIALPAVSKEDEAAAKAIAKLGLSANLYVLCRAVKDDVDLALNCDISNVIVEVPSSDVMIEKGFLWTREKVVEIAVETITYAKKHGLKVVFFPYDTTRANWEFERKLMKAAVDEGHADAVTIVDTFGVCIPEAAAYLVKKVKGAVKAPVEVHFHNDLGLAVANSVAGLAAGASCAHVTVNGVGDGCGNASFEEVAVALLTVYGVNLGLNYDKIYELSRMVQEYAGVLVEPRKPIVGENCFRKESGIFVMFRDRMIEAGVPTAACAYLPSLIKPGQWFSVVLGKKSGRNSIATKLREMGLMATEEQLESTLQRVKVLSIEKKRLITDEEFREILRSVGVI
jgi:isopropylmalate/homocitrate/citramalate synthase